MKLDIYKDKVMVRIPRQKISQLFKLIYSKELSPKSLGLVNLILTTDNKLKKLNSKYRAKNKPTDVLSFNYDKPLASDDVFGEIYISIATARKQALEYNWTINRELMRLSCHGFLHLLGYDHEKADDAAVMRKKEDFYLKKVN